jgi:hypothetical protein
MISSLFFGIDYVFCSGVAIALAQLFLVEETGMSLSTRFCGTGLSSVLTEYSLHG